MKILIPIDFSKEAHNALTLGTEIAEKQKAKIILLNIIEYTGTTSITVTGESPKPSTIDEIFTIKLIDSNKKRMNAIVEDLKSKNIEAEAKMEIGNPYKSISHLITDQKVDLVIMGSKGASGIQELLVGSNTEKVVRNANCPVLTVKEKIGLSKIKNYCHPTFFGLGE